MDYSHYQTITAECSNRILTLTLNRPEALNTISETMHTELAQIFIDAADDEDAHVIVLTGAGRVFCAGGEMAWLQKMVEHPETFEITARHGKRIVFSMLDCDKPIICMLNGPAAGLGANMALLSDIIFAADNVTISDPHVRIGLVAGDGGAMIWPQLIGYARAKEFLMTGDSIKAEEAAAMGLINRAVPQEKLREAVYSLAERLANGPTSAIRGTKKSINIPLKQLAHSTMDASLSYEAESNRTDDHNEGLAAFVEKRKARFTGS